MFSPPVTAEPFSGGIIGLRWYWILRDYNRTDHSAGLFGAESMVRGWRKNLRAFSNVARSSRALSGVDNCDLRAAVVYRNVKQGVVSEEEQLPVLAGVQKRHAHSSDILRPFLKF